MKIDRGQIPDFRVHPLGFYYLVLSSGKVTKRLHVYGKNAGLTVENAWHTHEFDLHSSILIGSIKNHIAEFVTASEGNLTEFSVDYADSRSILNKTGRLGEILEVASFTSTTGQDYFIKAGTIHRAKTIGSPCVTHVSMRHQGCKIFSYGAEETPFLRRQVNIAEASELLEILFQNSLLSPS